MTGGWVGWGLGREGGGEGVCGGGGEKKVLLSS